MNGIEKEDEDPDTSGLMFNILGNIGCQPVINKDGSLDVNYQGETFHMQFGGRFAQVWDPVWAIINNDDPRLPLLREAVNEVNFEFGPTLVISAPDSKGEVAVSSRRELMLHPACPENEPFVKSVLNSFFEAKTTLRQNYEQMVDKQLEQQRKRRPIGFDVHPANDTESTSNK